MGVDESIFFILPGLSSFSLLASIPPVTTPGNLRSETKSELMNRFLESQPELLAHQPLEQDQPSDNVIRGAESIDDIMARYRNIFKVMFMIEY